jgi:hypothetical protein
MKPLIDECLNAEVAKLAQSRGHGESSHVVWLGKGDLKDWSLKTVNLEGDWTFVTKNSIDFRGPASEPGSRGQYADVAVHAGLICLNGPEGMDLDLQLQKLGKPPALADGDEIQPRWGDVRINLRLGHKVLQNALCGDARGISFNRGLAVRRLACILG